MGIQFNCSGCNAKMNVPDSAAGKKARCTACGTVTRIPSVEEDIFPTISNAPHYPPSPELPPRPIHPREVEPLPEYLGNPMRGFWPDWLANFIVPFRANGRAILVLLVFMQMLGWAASEFVPLLGVLAQMAITGWIFAYYFRVIVETCRGEDHLPYLEIDQGFWEGIIRPMLLIVGGTVFLLLPWIAWSNVVAETGGLPEAFWNEAITWALLGLAVFLWPMVMLVMAIHGFSFEPFRLDRQLRSIFRASWGQYLVVVGFISAFILGYGAFSEWMTALRGSGGLGDPPSLWLRGGLAAANYGIEVYFFLLILRMIGLFYRYNKEHFVWQAE